MGDVDFVERMKRAPDEELISVVSSDGFRPEAVEAAQAELQRRNLDPNEFTQMKGQVEETRREEANKAELPLSTTAKLAFLAFAFSYSGVSWQQHSCGLAAMSEEAVTPSNGFWAASYSGACPA